MSKQRAEGTPNRGSVALAALAKGYGEQKRLAAELGADEGQFSRWVKGKRRPETAMRLKMQDRWAIPATDWDEPPLAEEPAPASSPQPTAGKEGAA